MKKPIYIAAIIFGLAACIGVFLNRNELFVYPGLRAHASHGLQDPASTQFRNEKLAPGGWLCGEMNSKNAYGAYTGFKRFISGSEFDVHLENTGYIGGKQSYAAEAENFSEQLQAEIEVMGLYNQLKKDVGSIEMPSKENISTMAMKNVFDGRWSKTCT